MSTAIKRNRKAKSARSQRDTRRNRTGMYELNRSVLAWTSNINDKTVLVLDKKTRNERRVTESLHWAVDRLDHHWIMYIVCVGVTPEGRVHFHPYVLNPNTEDNPGPHNHKNLVGIFNKAQSEKMALLNHKFEHGAMWMAALEEIDYSQEDLEKIWGMR